MWDRVSVKEYAKDFLRKYYWKAFLVCLIVALVTGSGNKNNSGSRGSNDGIGGRTGIVHRIDEVENRVPTGVGKTFYRILIGGLTLPLRLIGGGILFLITIIYIFIRMTIGYALEVGQARFFLRGFSDEREDPGLGNLISVFNSEEYFPVIKTQFIKSLYNFLWYFAFIIPGVIKSYEYRFVPYILANNPDLSTGQVIERSRQLTNGHKIEMFIMDLSFIGWYILGGLLFGLGIYFVNPYKEASFARLYDILNQQVVF